MWIVALVWLSFFGIFLSIVCIYLAGHLLAHPDSTRFSPLTVVSVFMVTAVILLAGATIFVSL